MFSRAYVSSGKNRDVPGDVANSIHCSAVSRDGNGWHVEFSVPAFSTILATSCASSGNDFDMGKDGRWGTYRFAIRMKHKTRVEASELLKQSLISLHESEEHGPFW